MYTDSNKTASCLLPRHTIFATFGRQLKCLLVRIQGGLYLFHYVLDNLNWFLFVFLSNLITNLMYTILQNKRRRWLGAPPPPPPPPTLFERQILPQQTIYRWKGNLTASRIHFKYWKNILISRFYEQFREMAPQWLWNGC